MLLNLRSPTVALESEETNMPLLTHAFWHRILAWKASFLDTSMSTVADKSLEVLFVAPDTTTSKPLKDMNSFLNEADPTVLSVDLSRITKSQLQDR